MYGDRKTMDFSPSLLGRTFRAVTLASTLLASVAVPFHIQTAAAASLKTGRYEAPNGSVIEVQGKSFYYTGKWNGEPVRRKPFVLELRPDATFMMARTVCSISDQSISCTSPSGNQTTYAIQLKQPQVVQQNPVGESNKQPAVQDTTNQKSEARLADLEGRLKNAQSELEAATEAKKSALDENALLRKETEKTLSDKSLAITVANAEAESAQKQVQILSADVKETQARELIAKSEAAALNERLVFVANEKAKEVEAAKLEATNAQTKLQAFTAEISELKSELQKKKSESSALLGVPTSVSAESLKEIEATKIEAAKAQTQVIALTEELKELRDKAGRAASETAAARDTLTAAVADKQKEVSVARADVEKTQKQLSVLTAERAALQEQADKAVAEATNMRKALELTIAQKTKDLEDAAADVATTRKKIEGLNAEMQETQVREKQAVAEVTSLRESLASATVEKAKELVSASAAVANADKKTQDLMAEVNQLKARGGPSVSELSALRSLSSALPPCPVEPRESKIDCLGIVTYGPGPNAGDYFLGEYRDGKRSGRGTYIFSDGRKYVGDWKDNKTEGFGILFNSDGSVRSKGIWSNNQFIRPAEAQNVPSVTSSPAQSSPSNSREVAVQQRREAQPTSVNEREIDILRQRNQALTATTNDLRQRLAEAEKKMEQKNQEEMNAKSSAQPVPSPGTGTRAEMLRKNADQKTEDKKPEAAKDYVILLNLKSAEVRKKMSGEVTIESKAPEGSPDFGKIQFHLGLTKPMINGPGYDMFKENFMIPLLAPINRVDEILTDFVEKNLRVSLTTSGCLELCTLTFLPSDFQSSPSYKKETACVQEAKCEIYKRISWEETLAYRRPIAAAEEAVEKLLKSPNENDLNQVAMIYIRSSSGYLCSTTELRSVLSTEGYLLDTNVRSWIQKRFATSSFKVTAAFANMEDLYQGKNPTRPNEKVSCNMVVETVGNLSKYVAALKSDQIEIEVSPYILSEEVADRAFAKSLGFENLNEFAFIFSINQKIPSFPLNVKTLKFFTDNRLSSVSDVIAIVDQIKSTGYAPWVNSDIFQQYLLDMNAGRKLGKNAKAVMEERIASDRKKAEQERQAFLQEHPYQIVLTCGTADNPHIMISACLYDGIDTEVELKNGSDYKLYKYFEAEGLGPESPQGVIISAKKSFAVKVQNASKMLKLGVQVVDASTGAVVFQRQVARYGVITYSR